MSDTLAINVADLPRPAYLLESEAAEYLRVHARTLKGWRLANKGPRCRRHGIKVLYTRADLDAWSEAQATKLPARDERGAA